MSVKLHNAATALNELLDTEGLIERASPSKFSDKGLGDFDDILGLQPGDLDEYIEGNTHVAHDRAVSAAVEGLMERYNGMPPYESLSRVPYVVSAYILRQGIQIGIMYSRLRAEEIREEMGE